MTLSISNSEIAAWDRCKRQWLLKYYYGALPADEPLVGNSLCGTRVHAALEGYYGYGFDPVALLGVIYDLAASEHLDWVTELMAERETAVTMITGYLDWIAETGKDAGLRVVATETEVEVPLPGVAGVKLKAKMDQVTYSEDTGLLSFLDHKTAANFDTHEQLGTKPQFKFYSIVQRLAGNGDNALVSGGYINTLRRVKRTAKSQPPYYQRDEFRYNDEQLDAALARITAVCGEIAEARERMSAAGLDLAAVNETQRRHLYPSPSWSGCKAWECPFTALCPMMDDGSDWAGVLMRSGRYIQDDPYKYYRDDPLKAAMAVLGQASENDGGRWHDGQP